MIALAPRARTKPKPEIASVISQMSEADIAAMYDHFKPQLLQTITYFEAAPEKAKQALAVVKSLNGHQIYDYVQTLKEKEQMTALLGRTIISPELAHSHPLFEALKDMSRGEVVELFETHFRPRIKTAVALIEGSLLPGGLKASLQKAQKLNGPQLARVFSHVKKEIAPLLSVLENHPQTAELHSLLDRALQMPAAEAGAFFDAQIQPELTRVLQKLETRLPEEGFEGIIKKLKNLSGDELAQAIVSEKEKFFPADRLPAPARTFSGAISGAVEAAEKSSGGGTKKTLLILGAGIASLVGLWAMAPTRIKPIHPAPDNAFNPDADIKLGALNKLTPAQAALSTPAPQAGR